MDRIEPYSEYEIQCMMHDVDLQYEELNKQQMTKTAKIEACDFIKTFDSRNGLMYSYKLKMSNGDVGSINSKSENPPFLAVGQELMYAVQTDPKYGDKFTRLQPDKDKPSAGAFKTGQNWEDEPNRQKMIVNQSQIKNAMDFLNTHGWEGKTKQEKVKELTDYAEIFANWVMR